MPKPIATKARIEVFRSGSFTPMSGGTVSYSKDDLAGIVTAYDPDAAPAPVVVGHPKTDAPAFGWVDGFEYDAEADRLYAEIGELEPTFSEAVSSGRYKKVSMSFFKPDAANNPVPGKWYPKHIGFLGAAAPAVSGLKPVSFSDDADDVIVFEAAFGERGFEDTAGLLRNLREWMIDKFSMEEADKVLPSWKLEWLDQTEIEGAKPSPQFSEPNKDVTMTPEEIAAKEAELAKREKELNDQALSFAERDAAARAAEHEAFAEELVSDERLLPVVKDKVVGILNALDADAEASFADGKSENLVEAFKDVLKAQPKIVDYGDAHLEERDEDAVASFSSDGKPVDRDQLALDAKARAFMAKSPNTDYLTAVQAVS